MPQFLGGSIQLEIQDVFGRMRKNIVDVVTLLLFDFIIYLFYVIPSYQQQKLQRI